MDPNANATATAQNRISDRIHDCRAIDDDLERLADLREALRDWLRAGGFRPEAMPHRCAECA